MNVKLLLDENLSVWVANALCREDGLDACHVRDRGLLGASDSEVLDKAFAEDRILVTANVDDFEKLARARELHAGIVLLEDGSLGRAGQLAAIRSAVVELQRQRDMVNRVLWISPDGTLTFNEVPPI